MRKAFSDGKLQINWNSCGNCQTSCFQARIQATMLNSYFKLESASFPEALKAAFSDGKLQINWNSSGNLPDKMISS